MPLRASFRMEAVMKNLKQVWSEGPMPCSSKQDEKAAEVGKSGGGGGGQREKGKAKKRASVV